MKVLLLTALFTLTVTTASAQSVATLTGGIGTLAGLIDGFTGTVVRATGGLFMALAMIAFFYGVVQYIWGVREGNETKIKNGNKFLKWSIVALFVMFSVYGIIRFGQRIVFGDADVSRIVLPQLIINGIGNPGNPGSGTNPGGSVGSPGTGSGLPSGPAENMIGGSCGRDGICSEGTCDPFNRCVPSSSGNPAGPAENMIGGSCGRDGICSEGTCDAVTNRCVPSSSGNS
jgi:hypothetical protein